ncbi:class I adenylate-forming enzyme family protein [Tsukamurella tyrosinosolvens]|uniref:class I adenylate-forming enzyme family protein n=1 Tax=Tsukamurella tyrosinosolvens TaxID=57704 RepID=UPI001C400A0A|nr:AMP-binding protein [Tsukamurella tyrosinosolvens]
MTEALDRWAATKGAQRFLFDGDREVEWSYRQFADTTDSIAGNLAARGIVKGDRVSVFLEDSVTTILWMFGIWKAGAVYCPINPAYTQSLLGYQIDDTAPRLLVTEATLVGRVAEVRSALPDGLSVVVATLDPAELPAPVGRLELLDGNLFLEPAAAPGIALGYADTANIIYTSGTTGRSKGVLQSHRWMNQYTLPVRLLTSTDDVIYSDLPMFHVGAAMYNVARAAWAGASVAVWRKFSSSEFWSRIESSGATIATLMGVMVPWLMNAPARPDDHVNSLNKVHMQPLPHDHHEVAQRFGIDYITTGFGQTEAGLAMLGLIEECAPGEGTPDSLYRGHSHEELNERLRSIGIPVIDGRTLHERGPMGGPSPFVEAAVHDPEDNPCPPGVPGELVLRPKAPSVIADGYLGKPEYTVQAWRNLWFHTGDAVWRREDGMWFFLDRMGDRIRRRGENISSQHLEELVSDYPGVTLAAAMPIPSADGSEDDIAVFVQGDNIDAEVILDWARDNIPAFMCPRRIIVSDSLPTTPTGKIQRFKLRERLLTEVISPEIDENETRIP